MSPYAVTDLTTRPQPNRVERTEVVDENVIHDLLNPMTSIIGNLHLLEDALGDAQTPAARRWIGACRDSTSQLQHMLENLRFVMNRPGNVSQTVEISVARVLERVVDDLSAQRPSDQPARARLQCDSDLFVVGNEVMLQRGLIAIHHVCDRAGRGGETTITAAADDPNRLEIRFAHAGDALPPAVAESMFRLDGAAVQRDHGMKLERARELVFAATVIDAHHGSIRYESNPQGGAIVVHLPRTAKGV